MKGLVSKRWGIDLLKKYANFFALINFVVGFGLIFISLAQIFSNDLASVLAPIFLLSGIVLVRFGCLITKNAMSR